MSQRYYYYTNITNDFNQTLFFSILSLFITFFQKNGTTIA